MSTRVKPPLPAVYGHSMFSCSIHLYIFGNVFMNAIILNVTCMPLPLFLDNWSQVESQDRWTNTNSLFLLCHDDDSVASSCLLPKKSETTSKNATCKEYKTTFTFLVTVMEVINASLFKRNTMLSYYFQSFVGEVLQWSEMTHCVLHSKSQVCCNRAVCARQSSLQAI